MIEYLTIALAVLIVVIYLAGAPFAAMFYTETRQEFFEEPAAQYLVITWPWWGLYHYYLWGRASLTGKICDIDGNWVDPDTALATYQRPDLPSISDAHRVELSEYIKKSEIAKAKCETCKGEGVLFGKYTGAPTPCPVCEIPQPDCVGDYI